MYVGGLEYTIGEVRVLDLGDEAGRLPQRTHGLQVDIDVEAFNPTDSQSMVNLMATLSWVDPESGLLHQGFGSPPQGAGVPGGGRANLALEYQVDGMEVDTFSLESAALRFGNEGQHAAVVPLGDEGELKSKFPHFQEQMVGVTVELEDVSWTIDEAFIGYNHGNSRLGDDQVLLEIAYTFANDSEHQQCHYRGDGQNFELLHTATGIGTTDLGTERCVRSGAQEQWRTGFLLPSDGFTGTWTLTVNQEYQDVLSTWWCSVRSTSCFCLLRCGPLSRCSKQLNLSAVVWSACGIASWKWKCWMHFLSVYRCCAVTLIPPVPLCSCSMWALCWKNGHAKRAWMIWLAACP